MPCARVDLHDVPENRLAADFHHGLGLDLRFLAQTRAESTCQNDCLHAIVPRGARVPSGRGIVFDVSEDRRADTASPSQLQVVRMRPTSRRSRSRPDNLR